MNMKMNSKKLAGRKSVVFNGTVTMPLNEYNALVKKLTAYESALVVRYDNSTWRGTKDHEIKVEFKTEPFHELILDRIAEMPIAQLAIFEGQDIDFDRTIGYSTICTKSEPIEEKTEE